MLFNESSFKQLYNSAVAAFPQTTKRQHATNPIKVTELYWVPFLGLKTLFVRALARNENRDYNPIILFKNVNYQVQENDRGTVRLITNDGQKYILEQLSSKDTEILVRCDCKDFRYRFMYYNFQDHALYGNKRKRYESLGLRPPANQSELPGMCKHLMKMFKVLEVSGIVR